MSALSPTTKPKRTEFRNINAFQDLPTYKLPIAGIVGWTLTIVLIGFPILWIVGALGFLVMVWFTIKSALGLLALLDDRSR